jgi:hypothetical protein
MSQLSALWQVACFPAAATPDWFSEAARVAIRSSQLDDRASEEFVRLEAEILFVIQSCTASFADQALEADESGVGVLMSDLSGTAKLLDWRTKIPKVSMRVRQYSDRLNLKIDHIQSVLEEEATLLKLVLPSIPSKLSDHVQGWRYLQTSSNAAPPPTDSAWELVEEKAKHTSAVRRIRRHVARIERLLAGSDRSGPAEEDGTGTGDLPSGSDDEDGDEDDQHDDEDDDDLLEGEQQERIAQMLDAAVEE